MRIKNNKLERGSVAFYDAYGRPHQVDICEWELDISPEHLDVITKHLGSVVHIKEMVCDKPELEEEITEPEEYSNLEITSTETEKKPEITKELPKKTGKKG